MVGHYDSVVVVAVAFLEQSHHCALDPKPSSIGAADFGLFQEKALLSFETQQLLHYCQ